MPTASNIPEISFRIGCGRYIQEDGALARLGEEILRLGAKKPFIIGGKTAFSLTEARIRASLDAAGLAGVFRTYTAFCCREICAELTAAPDFAGCDVVVGVGGGNVMDAAKYIAVTAGLPVINVPTSSATCAAFTPLSVCYNRAWQTVNTAHHKTEVNAVLADMDILSRQPVRLLLAGIYDALAKVYELRQRMLGIAPQDLDVGLAASFEMSVWMCEQLEKNKAAAAADVAAGKNTKTVYDTVYMAIALTGVISGLARGSNQCAIGHKVYEAARTLYPDTVRTYLHGELVAIGLIAQILYNDGGARTAADAFAAEMRRLGMPASLHEVGIPQSAETVRAFYDNIVKTPAMAGTNDAEKAILHHALEAIL